MSRIDKNQNPVEDHFTLIIDQYGRLWLQSKLNGTVIDIDLGEKNVAFEIMASTMAENDFRYIPSHVHDAPDNDDGVT
jgi:hypothetical protein